MREEILTFLVFFNGFSNKEKSRIQKLYLFLANTIILLLLLLLLRDKSVSFYSRKR